MNVDTILGFQIFINSAFDETIHMLGHAKHLNDFYLTLFKYRDLCNLCQKLSKQIGRFINSYQKETNAIKLISNALYRVSMNIYNSKFTIHQSLNFDTVDL